VQASDPRSSSPEALVTARPPSPRNRFGTEMKDQEGRQQTVNRIFFQVILDRARLGIETAFRLRKLGPIRTHLETSFFCDLRFLLLGFAEVCPLTLLHFFE